MSILDRLNLLIRSNINDATGRTSPRRALSEMENSLRDARRQRVELKRGEAQLIRQIRETRERADQWEERAMLALRRGEEDLAREALIVKNKAMREAENLRDQLDDQRAYLQDIERALEALEAKLEGTRARLRASSSPGPRRSGEPRLSDWDREMERRRRQREAGEAPSSESRSSECRSSESRSSGSRSAPPRSTEPRRAPVDPDIDDRFDTSRSFSEMNRMASKIDSMEAEIEAIRELDDLDPRRSELESIFRRMEGGQRPSSGRDGRRDDRRSDRRDSDDDLADLKAKFE